VGEGLIDQVSYVSRYPPTTALAAAAPSIDPVSMPWPRARATVTRTRSLSRAASAPARSFSPPWRPTTLPCRPGARGSGRSRPAVPGPRRPGAPRTPLAVCLPLMSRSYPDLFHVDLHAADRFRWDRRHGPLDAALAHESGNDRDGWQGHPDDERAQPGLNHVAEADDRSPSRKRRSAAAEQAEAQAVLLALAGHLNLAQLQLVPHHGEQACPSAHVTWRWLPGRDAGSPRWAGRSGGR
jgi:hypothetical protein